VKQRACVDVERRNVPEVHSASINVSSATVSKTAMTAPTKPNIFAVSKPC